MDEREPLLEHWRELDAGFQRVRDTRWGAVVSDDRYPAVWEPNYARVEARESVRLAEIEAELLPEMARCGSERSHVVIFSPPDQTDLIAEASTRGDRITWDLVMVRDREATDETDPRGVTEEVDDPDEPFWRAHATSTRILGVDEEPTLEQLQALEREVMIPAGRRWFTIREAQEPVALASMLVLAGSAYLDHVVTFPYARRRGYARALTRRVLAEAADADASRTFLLAEPGGVAERIYAGLGFRRAGHLASWLSPIAR